MSTEFPQFSGGAGGSRSSMSSAYRSNSNTPTSALSSVGSPVSHPQHSSSAPTTSRVHEQAVCRVSADDASVVGIALLEVEAVNQFVRQRGLDAPLWVESPTDQAPVRYDRFVDWLRRRPARSGMCVVLDSMDSTVLFETENRDEADRYLCMFPQRCVVTLLNPDAIPIETPDCGRVAWEEVNNVLRQWHASPARGVPEHCLMRPAIAAAAIRGTDSYYYAIDTERGSVEARSHSKALLERKYPGLSIGQRAVCAAVAGDASTASASASSSLPDMPSGIDWEPTKARVRVDWAALRMQCNSMRWAAIAPGGECVVAAGDDLAGALAAASDMSCLLVDLQHEVPGESLGAACLSMSRSQFGMLGAYPFADIPLATSAVPVAVSAQVMVDPGAPGCVVIDSQTAQLLGVTACMFQATTATILGHVNMTIGAASLATSGCHLGPCSCGRRQCPCRTC